MECACAAEKCWCACAAPFKQFLFNSYSHPNTKFFPLTSALNILSQHPLSPLSWGGMRRRTVVLMVEADFILRRHLETAPPPHWRKLWAQFSLSWSHFRRCLCYGKLKTLFCLSVPVVILSMTGCELLWASLMLSVWKMATGLTEGRQGSLRHWRIPRPGSTLTQNSPGLLTLDTFYIYLEGGGHLHNRFHVKHIYNCLLSVSIYVVHVGWGVTPCTNRIGWFLSSVFFIFSFWIILRSVYILCSRLLTRGVTLNRYNIINATHRLYIKA